MKIPAFRRFALPSAAVAALLLTGSLPAAGQTPTSPAQPADQHRPTLQRRPGELLDGREERVHVQVQHPAGIHNHDAIALTSQIMAMNLVHRVWCSSNAWARSVERSLLPWALADVELGDNTLEIGPGYGANLRVLVDKTRQLTAVEIDAAMAERLRGKYGERARIIHGDGSDTGLPAEDFSSVVCFTMLHHVPTPALQDQLLAEAFRVLRPGGVFAGSDSAASTLFRLLHFRDTCNPVHPQTFPEHLRAAGFDDVHVEANGRRLRWRAVKAGS